MEPHTGKTFTPRSSASWPMPTGASLRSLERIHKKLLHLALAQQTVRLEAIEDLLDLMLRRLSVVLFVLFLFG